MRRLGDMNFTLEDLIEVMIEKDQLKWSDIFSSFYSTLKSHPAGLEEFVDGGNPQPFLVYNGSHKVLTIKDKTTPSKANNKVLKDLVKEYSKDHDLQWGEVLYIVYGYLCIHRPDAKDCDFYYGESISNLYA
jgi:hypothetical protein